MRSELLCLRTEEGRGMLCNVGRGGDGMGNMEGEDGDGGKMKVDRYSLFCLDSHGLHGTS